VQELGYCGAKDIATFTGGDSRFVKILRGK